jgi:hypothetical protein
LVSSSSAFNFYGIHDSGFLEDNCARLHILSRQMVGTPPGAPINAAGEPSAKQQRNHVPLGLVILVMPLLAGLGTKFMDVHLTSPFDP